MGRVGIPSYVDLMSLLTGALCVPQVGNYAALFSQALPRDAHSTPFYCTRPQSLALGYGERTLSASLGTSGISSLGVYTLNGPTPTPQSLLAG